jgi:CheY-like chemotaxis protein
MPPHTRPVVLLVDDDADTLDMYDVGLTYDGFDAFTTRSAAGVAGRVQTLHADVVVTDLNLTGAIGWHVVEALKSDPFTRDIPVVVLTGWTDETVARRAHELGCATVLTKPCLPETLAGVLKDILQRHA